MFTGEKAVKTVSFMILATLLAKVLGMFRDIFLANFYGTGMEAVAFLAASRIPLLFFDIGLGAAITSTFIPVYNEYLEKNSKKEAVRFSNIFINTVLIAAVLITLIGNVFAHQLVNLIAQGLDYETHFLCVKLVRIMFPMVIFAGIAFSFVGILHSFKEFNIPAIISLVSNIIIIFYFLFLNNRFGIYGLAITMVIAWSFQVIVQIPSLKKNGYKYQFLIDFRNPGIRKVSIAAVPILVSTWVQPINTMVNIRLASNLNDSSAVAALDYANKLYIIVVGVFTYALANLVFPILSRLNAGNEKAKFKLALIKTLRVVFFVITPLMIGFAVLRIPLIRLVYERGEFKDASTNLTSIALLFYSTGMVGFAVYEILNKAFYAMHKPKTPMKVAVISITLNILLSISFVKLLGFGIGGLAFAASIAAYFSSIILLIIINKKLSLFEKKLWLFIIKVFAISGIMGIIVMHTLSYLPVLSGQSLVEKGIRIIILGFVGIFTYIIGAFLFRIEEIEEITGIILKRLKRK